VRRVLFFLMLSSYVYLVCMMLVVEMNKVDVVLIT
jgi:hypothetical protein